MKPLEIGLLTAINSRLNEDPESGQIDLAFGAYDRHPIEFGCHFLSSQGETRGDFYNRIRFASFVPGYGNTSSLQPLGCSFDHQFSRGLCAIHAFGILDGGEFLLSE